MTGILRNKSKKKTKKRGVAFNYLTVFTIGIISYIFLLAISSLIILNVAIKTDFLYLFILVSSAFSVLISTVIFCITQNRKSLLLGMSLCLLLAVIEFTVLLFFNNADLKYQIYLIFPIDIISGFIGCIAGINIRK